MVELAFSSLTQSDVVLAILVNAIGFTSIATSCVLSNRKYPKWVSRKLTHVAVSSLIALFLPLYSSLTGPALTLAIFLVGILAPLAFGCNAPMIALSAGTRDEGHKLQTFLAAFLALVAFGLVFLIFMSIPAIFVASILAVSWGDGAGEIVGRPYGRHKFHLWHGRTKSVEGSLAVTVMTFVAVLTAFILFPLARSSLSLLLIAIIVALAVTVAEVICVSWTDNVVIPLLSAFLLWFLLSLPM